MSDRILLDCGSGGRASHRLVADLFLKHLGNPELNRLNDAACLNLKSPLAMSTDTFTVDPIFFPGGDIGSLAVHGTVNDVSMLGAIPRYLTCGFIVEEGLETDVLARVVASMGTAAREAGVLVVAGDTKVVPRGMVDKIFINTTGVGEIFVDPTPSGDRARPGDAILVTGSMGDHGLAVLSTRQGLAFDTPVVSDAASLNHAIARLLRAVPEVHVLRDPTRGGLGTTLNEIAESSGVCCEIVDEAIPVRPEVRDGCSFLGLDPLYLANEGKFLCILPGELADAALDVLRGDPLCAGAVRIGTVTDAHPGKVVLTTRLGGARLLTMLEGEQLPRIC
ncbi:hydrogenase expression/formation protein HypE [Desulfovibrio sulfodismutans]|uniref:Hydrogenase expression/formation protein HypE n=1 Tax=Desulfolutivibrio sulfodismutans TaxID=63561 RepID=A0A7K3NM66_9BACT|nr:hydrogenase expression/formation protein HypE [Desulfolutivibrio sulfodismutans]NDY56923.1 hydrogenase expression/formation protein HypE [Desulfolutivibrio sulfodismutans]QLA12946.1 hydrogenase expression/formation protein HypE [Desulfolutivibrio sulfodismutans DSM 3696]